VVAGALRFNTRTTHLRLSSSPLKLFHSSSPMIRHQ
jgi:hypothetical protein